MASRVARVAALQAFRLVLTVVLAWLATDLVCVVLEFTWPRATDFVCGHNVFLQLPLLLVAVYLLLGLIPALKLPTRITEEHNEA